MRRHCDALQNALAELIRPELDQHKRGGPFIILASETGLKCDGYFYGLTSDKMAIWLRDEIRDWRNGPAMLLNDAKILADCVGYVPAALAVITSLAVHELAHCLAVPKLCGDAEPVDARFKVLFPLMAADAKPTWQHEIDYDRVAHDREFIRLALHIRSRMIQRGWFVPLYDLLDWDHYANRGAQQYLATLAEDFLQCADKPLSEINQVKAPAEFLKLFNKDDSNVESEVVGYCS
ncbi:MAG: hypothetical protein NTX48_07860 [Planctomycetales bacterium]|nr:hypothetical protein [Planctomycetales bacterium]